MGRSKEDIKMTTQDKINQRTRSSFHTQTGNLREEVEKEMNAKTEQMLLFQVLEEHIDKSPKYKKVETCENCIRLALNKGYRLGKKECEEKITKLQEKADKWAYDYLNLRKEQKAKVEKLKRYDLWKGYNEEYKMEELVKGDYVKFEDLIEIFSPEENHKPQADTRNGSIMNASGSPSGEETKKVLGIIIRKEGAGVYDKR